ncbi:MAG: YlxR family protein [bacterium]|nr:YlxR family protein [bacterium]
MKKVPYRMCVVTREKLPKRDLIRVVLFDGKISVDVTGKQNGRGCYMKKDEAVIELAKKNKVLNKVFEMTVDDEIYEEIKKSI